MPVGVRQRKGPLFCISGEKMEPWLVIYRGRSLGCVVFSLEGEVLLVLELLAQKILG